MRTEQIVLAPLLLTVSDPRLLYETDPSSGPGVIVFNLGGAVSSSLDVAGRARAMWFLHLQALYLAFVNLFWPKEPEQG